MVEVSEGQLEAVVVMLGGTQACEAGVECALEASVLQETNVITHNMTWLRLVKCQLEAVVVLGGT